MSLGSHRALQQPFSDNLKSSLLSSRAALLSGRLRKLLQLLPGPCPVVGGRCWAWALLNTCRRQGHHFCAVPVTSPCKGEAAVPCCLCCEAKGVPPELGQKALVCQSADLVVYLAHSFCGSRIQQKNIYFPRVLMQSTVR